MYNWSHRERSEVTSFSMTGPHRLYNYDTPISRGRRLHSKHVMHIYCAFSACVPCHVLSDSIKIIIIIFLLLTKNNYVFKGLMARVLLYNVDLILYII